jgi:polysaccharide chain length determinant protein (PEP-CTERM system associated)
MFNDILQQVQGYVVAAWRRRWLALIVAWLVCIAGWIAVERIPDSYSASARIYIDTETMLGPLMQGIAADMSDSVLSELALVRRSLTSRPNMERVMRMADLDLNARGPADEDRIIASITSRLSVDADRSGIFTISFTDAEPQVAYNVVEAVRTVFVEANLGASREDLTSTMRFLDDQIRDLEQQLQDRERALAQFDIENRGFLPGTNNYEARLSAARSDLARLEQERSEAIVRRDEMEQDLARMLDNLSGPEPTLSPRAARITELESYLTELQLRYTDRHPEVILTRRLLQRERALLDQDVQSGAATTTNPLIEQAQSSLNRQEAAIGSYDQRIDGLRSTIAELESLIEQIPEVLQERRRLERQLDLVRSNHSSLVQRREQARWAAEIDTSTEAVEFRVIEPPTMPREPSGPNRLLLRSGVLVGGLGAGAAFALLLGFIANTIATGQRLEQVTQRPLLGAVTTVRLPAERRRRYAELAGFAVVLFGLFGAYAGVMAGLVEGPLAMLTRGA